MLTSSPKQLRVLSNSKIVSQSSTSGNPRLEKTNNSKSKQRTKDKSKHIAGTEAGAKHSSNIIEESMNSYIEDEIDKSGIDNEPTFDVFEDALSEEKLFK